MNIVNAMIFINFSGLHVCFNFIHLQMYKQNLCLSSVRLLVTEVKISGKLKHFCEYCIEI